MKRLPVNLNLLLVGALILVLLGGGWFAFSRFINTKSQTQLSEESELVFDLEGPYALLIPRKDGNALMLNLKRTASYDSISYELAYNAEGIDRGVVGNLDATQKKGEYSQEILFGTCSKNVCKYDKGVENGTLTLHITKGNQRFRMNTQWHLQRLDLAKGVITSGDGHFTYKTTVPTASTDTVTQTYIITNDLSGMPKLPAGKKVVSKVYAVNLPLTKSLPTGEVSLETAEKLGSTAKVNRYDDSSNGWAELSGKSTPSQGIFALLDISK